MQIGKVNAASTKERWSWRNWRMGSRYRKVQEIRLVADVFANVLHCLIGEVLEHIMRRSDSIRGP